MYICLSYRYFHETQYFNKITGITPALINPLHATCHILNKLAQGTCDTATTAKEIGSLFIYYFRGKYSPSNNVHMFGGHLRKVLWVFPCNCNYPSGSLCFSVR
jgi:hypothetical protein